MAWPGDFRLGCSRFLSGQECLGRGGEKLVAAQPASPSAQLGAAGPRPRHCTPEPIRHQEGMGGGGNGQEAKFRDFLAFSRAKVQGLHSICQPSLGPPPTQGRPHWKKEKCSIKMLGKAWRESETAPPPGLRDPPALGSRKGPSPIGHLDVGGRGDK